MRIPKHLRNIKEGALEVRRLDRGENFLYEVSLPSVALADISVRKKGVFYLIRKFFPDDEEGSYIGFTFTKDCADKFAHRQAVSLANKIAGYNGLKVSDFSERDIQELKGRLGETQ